MRSLLLFQLYVITSSFLFGSPSFTNANFNVRNHYNILASAIKDKTMKKNKVENFGHFGHFKLWTFYYKKVPT